jgi:hypothetical protein
MAEPANGKQDPATSVAPRLTSGKKGRKQRSLVVTKPPTPWNFPKHTLEDAILAAQAFEEKFASKPTPASDFVKAVGFRQSDDWRFKDLMKSADFYGLLKWEGATKDIEGTALGSDIVTPSDPAQRQKALLSAFNNVELFKKVAEHYAGKKIPEDEFFSNTLIRQFEVPRDRVETFIKVFTGNLNYLKAFAADKTSSGPAPFVSSPSASLAIPNIPGGEAVSNDTSKTPREFLDTCFVLMPFGDWYDRYFKDIYIPATKEAGFEPVRADGLFSTGSVMEQIWEQIRKAKVLLADLTGKNANVFYELGLAHAESKPVVLVTGNLDDVPFDLRHLRVVVYDQREPNWGEKLREGIAAYLKAAKAEPDKSIPQPFRVQPVQKARVEDQ